MNKKIKNFIKFSFIFFSILLSAIAGTYFVLILINEYFKNVLVSTNHFSSLDIILRKQYYYLFQQINFDKVAFLILFFKNFGVIILWCFIIIALKYGVLYSKQEDIITLSSKLKNIFLVFTIFLGIKTGFSVIYLYKISGEINLIKNFLIYSAILIWHAIPEFIVLTTMLYILYYQNYLVLKNNFDLSIEQISIIFNDSLMKILKLLPIYAMLLLIAAYIEVKIGVIVKYLDINPPFFN